MTFTHTCLFFTLCLPFLSIAQTATSPSTPTISPVTTTASLDCSIIIAKNSKPCLKLDKALPVVDLSQADKNLAAQKAHKKNKDAVGALIFLNLLK